MRIKAASHAISELKRPQSCSAEIPVYQQLVWLLLRPLLLLIITGVQDQPSPVVFNQASFLISSSVLSAVLALVVNVVFFLFRRHISWERVPHLPDPFSYLSAKPISQPSLSICFKQPRCNKTIQFTLKALLVLWTATLARFACCSS